MKFQQFVIILASIFVLLFSFNSVFPHSCATFKNLTDKEHLQKLSETKIFFQGEIISISNDEIFDDNRFYKKYYTINFKVIKSWKGIETATTTALFAVDNPCGLKLEVGRKYMVYSFDSNNPFEIDCCNFGLFDEKRIQNQLGGGIIIEETQTSQLSPTPNESTEGFWSNLWNKITSFFS